MTQMEKPDFDLFELTHWNDDTKKREINEDVSGELRRKVAEYLDAIEAPRNLKLDLESLDLDGDA